MPSATTDVRRSSSPPSPSPQPSCSAYEGTTSPDLKELGIELKGRSEGGGSDGNFTGYMGIPTLDSLGVRGKGLHTLTEHIEVDSLVERARLMAGLLMKLT